MQDDHLVNGEGFGGVMADDLKWDVGEVELENIFSDLERIFQGFAIGFEELFRVADAAHIGVDGSIGHSLEWGQAEHNSHAKAAGGLDGDHENRFSSLRYSNIWGKSTKSFRVEPA